MDWNVQLSEWERERVCARTRVCVCVCEREKRRGRQRGCILRLSSYSFSMHAEPNLFGLNKQDYYTTATRLLLQRKVSKNALQRDPSRMCCSLVDTPRWYKISETLIRGNVAVTGAQLALARPYKDVAGASSGPSVINWYRYLSNMSGTANSHRWVIVTGSLVAAWAVDVLMVCLLSCDDFLSWVHFDTLRGCPLLSKAKNACTVAK